MIVLVGGLPGSGKSYFASRLAERTGFDYLSSDKVRKTIEASGKYNVADKLIVYKHLAELAEIFLKRSRSVIIDATFSHVIMRDVFYRLAGKYSVPCKFILVYADEEVIRQRLSRPRPDSDADFKVFELIKSQYEPVTTRHLLLQSGESNLSVMYRKALNYIKEP